MPATRMDIQHGEPMMLEEETNTPGSYEAMFPSHRQVPNRDSKSKWWWPVWRQWRSQSWENCEHHTGRASKCGEISPTFEMQLQDLDKQQNNLLPSGQSVPPCQQPQPAPQRRKHRGNSSPSRKHIHTNRMPPWEKKCNHQLPFMHQFHSLPRLFTSPSVSMHASVSCKPALY